MYFQTHALRYVETDMIGSNILVMTAILFQETVVMRIVKSNQTINVILETSLSLISVGEKSAIC